MSHGRGFLCSLGRRSGERSLLWAHSTAYGDTNPSGYASGRPEVCCTLERKASAPGVGGTGRSRIRRHLVWWKHGNTGRRFEVSFFHRLGRAVLEARVEPHGDDGDAAEDVEDGEQLGHIRRRGEVGDARPCSPPFSTSLMLELSYPSKAVRDWFTTEPAPISVSPSPSTTVTLALGCFDAA